MVRGRSKKTPVEEQPADDGDALDAEAPDGPMDVNSVVSYNVKRIRKKREMTQQDVAEHLARFTGRLLPQASISAMELGFEGERRRRFDAHELYLLSLVFGVPIVYFFLPPPETGFRQLADSGRPVSELYVSVLGRDHQLAEFDDRLEELNIHSPGQVDDVAVAIFGDPEAAAQNWHQHYRTWRKKRLAQIARTYGDRLDEVAAFLAEFANEITQLGPKSYLQAKAHKRGEKVVGPDGEE
jgi:transcriptional regulator with XRE-family HTH domain